MFRLGHSSLSNFKSSPMAVYESLFALQNCIITHNDPHTVISAPGYRGKNSCGGKIGKLDTGGGEGDGELSPDGGGDDEPPREDGGDDEPPWGDGRNGEPNGGDGKPPWDNGGENGGKGDRPLS